MNGDPNITPDDLARIRGLDDSNLRAILQTIDVNGWTVAWMALEEISPSIPHRRGSIEDRSSTVNGHETPAPGASGSSSRT
jgi:hypothetical protein